MEGQITIKRNVADDLNALAAEMVEEQYKLNNNADAMRDDEGMIRQAAIAMHKYQLMVDNGVPEILAAMLAVR